ncbi:MAG TPA: ATP-binding protein, partial [Chitinispirillaceae bacterium]|nr:ATP-binding protein [Chitinispirillaceae bacterium]
MSDYERGSVWRRWDLHLHTKGTLKSDNFTSADLNEFCKAMFRKAVDAEVAAIGITDYFSIDNYNRVVEYVQSIKDTSGFTEEDQKKIKSIFILPNVELRMLPVTDSGRLVNIHCIFDPQYINSLENDFFAAIKHSDGPGCNHLMNRSGMIGLGKSMDAKLDDEGAYKKGINSFVVSHERLQELYEQNRDFREHVIIAVSNSNKDGASALQKHYDLFEDVEPGSLDGLRRAIYKLSDVVFSGNEKDRLYFLGDSKDNREEVITKCGSIKPCIHGSDAHTEDELFLPANKRFCWIKADPTFQGLKQIVFEPKDRVRIQESNPSKDFEKPYFNSIDVNGQAIIGGVPSFQKMLLPLNPGLVALIGGRGTGKSILLDCVYKLFNNVVGDKDRFADIAPESLEIVFSKSDGTEIKYTYGNRDNAELDYLHVRQGEVKEIARKPEALSDAIKRLLGIDISSRAPDYDQEISVIIDRIEKSLAWFYLKNEEWQLINGRKHNENVIKSNQALINTITTDQNRENIEKYQKNQQEINLRKSAIARLIDFKTSLASHKLEIN